MKDRRLGQCETCKHWYQISENNYDKGFCHRYPPTVSFYENVAPKFPVTFRYMFCGEWDNEKK